MSILTERLIMKNKKRVKKILASKLDIKKLIKEWRILHTLVENITKIDY